jgi:hypothetical protein
MLMALIFLLYQRNEVGSSPAMEYEGFCRSMEYLLTLVAVKTFVSDRHSSITKHMREKLSDIIHYFDIWHLKKSMTLNFLPSVMDHLHYRLNFNLDKNFITA